MDKVDAATRSRIMSRIRGKDTQPELLLRRELSAHGIRYRLHQRGVFGTPDLSHKGHRLAVFVDGCFWHGCPSHYRAPSSRNWYWSAKLKRNKVRRGLVLARLASEGWRAVQVWECEVHADVGLAASRVALALKSGQ
ncbi:MAG TPA: very short patch repair endonuclease [Candidatus Thermoplasmatota archaeon]|nr:very short patch repair endonuclease [Candidatus Thermoplasmatota archaeon]